MKFANGTVSRRRKHPGSPGQAAVELAMLVPLLLILTVAFCQVALALNCYLVLSAASREGARRGAETNDESAARLSAERACSGLPGTRPRVEVTFPEGRERGRPIGVTVSHDPPLLVPGLDRLIPGLRFKSTTWMALERGR